MSVEIDPKATYGKNFSAVAQTDISLVPRDTIVLGYVGRVHLPQIENPSRRFDGTRPLVGREHECPNEHQSNCRHFSRSEGELYGWS